MREPKFGDVYQWTPTPSVGTSEATKAVMYIGPDMEEKGLWVGIPLLDPVYQWDGWSSSGITEPDNGTARWELRS